MNYQLLPSCTSITAVAFETRASTLDVWFRTTGRQYRYYGVPMQLYCDLLSADSKGRFFNQHIRDGPFQYERIEPQPEPTSMDAPFERTAGNTARDIPKREAPVE